MSTVERRYAGKYASGVRIDAAPFQRWVRELVVRERAARGPGAAIEMIVAERLGVRTRALYAWLNETSETVDERVVEEAVTAHGAYTVEEIYDLFAADRPVRTSLIRRECATPGCCQDRSDSTSRFCVSCGERLARVRGEYEADASRFRARIGRNGSRPICCNPACGQTRPTGERFCYECRDAGWGDEAGE